MTPSIRFSIVLGATLGFLLSCNEPGVDRDEAIALCHDVCDRLEECFGADADADNCAAGCEDDGSRTCSNERQDEIADHLRGCVAGECGALLQCVDESPDC